jgi:hypothetical protein
MNKGSEDEFSATRSFSNHYSICKYFILVKNINTAVFLTILFNYRDPSLAPLFHSEGALRPFLKSQCVVTGIVLNFL